MAPSYVKIMVFRPLVWAVHEEEEEEENRGFGQFPYILLAMVFSYFVSVFRYKMTQSAA